MKPVLLTDFGSTYTKLTAVDLDAAKLLGTAQAYTTVASDVRIGFQKALDALLAQTGPLTFAQSFACSSAAGGLRMMVSGLVPELTMEAARLASLGAGANLFGRQQIRPRLPLLARERTNRTQRLADVGIGYGGVYRVIRRISVARPAGGVRALAQFDDICLRQKLESLGAVDSPTVG